MFKERGLFRTRVESDEGFTVELLGRVHLRYREGGRSILIGAERHADGMGYTVLSSPMGGWEAPHSSETLTDVEWQRVFRNVLAALEFLRMRIDVED